MQTIVKMWGNSLGVQLPQEILKDAGVALNDCLNIKVLNGAIILEKQFRHKTLEERAAKFDGKLGLDGEYDWGECI